ncbi:MAG TPA: haloacid dehalogenase [Acidimicrobiia bacterium]|nr:haloacid dehalogenase [Acidimicrobiia bacterium]
MDRAGEINALGAAVRDALDERHRAREVTIAASRTAIQACARSIRATHRGEYAAAAELARDAQAHVAEADAALADHPEIRATGPLHDAKKELAEAFLTLALVRDDPLPAPADLGIDAAAWCNGLAEAASELRRAALDRLRAGDLDRAEHLVGAMDDVYGTLVTIDYPDGVTGGLRRTTDALRAVLERTRGDLTTALVAHRLQHAIETADRHTR